MEASQVKVWMAVNLNHMARCKVKMVSLAGLELPQ